MYSISSDYSRLELAFHSESRNSCTVVLCGPGVRAEATLEFDEDDEDGFDHPSWFFQSLARHQKPWLDAERYETESFSVVAECSASGAVTLFVTVAGTTGAETWTAAAPLTVGIDQLPGIAKGILSASAD